jgi:tetratricopeptide (TPR) repeat protein
VRFAPYVALGLGAFLLRGAFLLEWSDTTLATVLVGDAREYDRWARSLAAGDWLGREVFYQAPLYPYVVAAVYKLAGPSTTALRLVQVAGGSIAVVLVALAGRRFFDERVGLVAGGMLAAYGPAIHADGLVQKGGLGGLLMALVLFATGELASRRSASWALGCGVALGLLALTRENALVLPPIVALWLALDPRCAPRVRSLRIAAVALGLALVLVPVGLRNAALGGRFLVTTSQSGPNFYIGNNPQATGRYAPLREGRGDARYERTDATLLAQAARGRELTPAEVSAYWFERSREWIAERPGAWFALLGRKAGLTWHAGEIMDTDSLEAHADESAVLRLTSSVLHFGIVVPLALVGVWATRRNWRRLWILYAMALALAASVALFFVMARYRNTLVPIVLLFAAAAVVEIVRCARARRWRWLAVAGAAIATAGIAVNWPLQASVDPRSITWYSLGQALLEEGRLDEARRQLERAVEIEPGFAEAHVRLADLHARAGRSGDAERHARRAIDLEPGHGGAWTILGSLRLAQGRSAEAGEAYRQALEVDRSNPAAHNNLAVLLAGEGRLEEAVAHWRASLALEASDPAVWTNLGKVLSVLGRTAEATAALERALALDPGNLEARRWLERNGPGENGDDSVQPPAGAGRSKGTSGG